MVSLLSDIYSRQICDDVFAGFVDFQQGLHVFKTHWRGIFVIRAASPAILLQEGCGHLLKVVRHLIGPLRITGSQQGFSQHNLNLLGVRSIFSGKAFFKKARLAS